MASPDRLNSIEDILEYNLKKELMKKTAGAFRGTSLDKDILWKKVLKKKSRKETIILL